ncbi:GPI mannosyltransferase 1, partial [Rhizophlyctis rosea]
MQVFDETIRSVDVIPMPLPHKLHLTVTAEMLDTKRLGTPKRPIQASRQTTEKDRWILAENERLFLYDNHIPEHEVDDPYGDLSDYPFIQQYTLPTTYTVRTITLLSKDTYIITVDLPNKVLDAFNIRIPTDGPPEIFPHIEQSIPIISPKTAPKDELSKVTIKSHPPLSEIYVVRTSRKKGDGSMEVLGKAELPIMMPDLVHLIRPEGHAVQIVVGNSTIPKLLQFEFDDKGLRHVDTIRLPASTCAYGIIDLSDPDEFGLLLAKPKRTNLWGNQDSKEDISLGVYRRRVGRAEGESVGSDKRNGEFEMKLPGGGWIGGVGKSLLSEVAGAVGGLVGGIEKREGLSLRLGPGADSVSGGRSLITEMREVRPPSNVGGVGGEVTLESVHRFLVDFAERTEGTLKRMEDRQAEFTARAERALAKMEERQVAFAEIGERTLANIENRRSGSAENAERTLAKMEDRKVVTERVINPSDMGASSTRQDRATASTPDPHDQPPADSKPFHLSSQITPKSIFLASVILHILFLLYGAYQDTHPTLKFTDIDYEVFTDGARFISRSSSPYARATYRYTPLLAYLVLPNVYLFHSFGKVLFSAVDLLVGWLLLDLLRRKGLSERTAAMWTGAVWMCNPFVVAISTRGNAESVV